MDSKYPEARCSELVPDCANAALANQAKTSEDQKNKRLTIRVTS